MITQTHNQNQVAIERAFDWARKELETNQNIFFKKKSQVINELADRLARAGVQPQKISTLIIKQLKGYVTQPYVSTVLPPEYKQEYRSKNGKKRKSSINSYAKRTETIPPTESQEDKIIWQIKPEEYRIKEVEQYDKSYLIGVVKFLDKENRHQQPQPKEKIYHLKPEQYKEEDLDKYDKAYLIRIINWYETQTDRHMQLAHEFDARIRDLIEENEDLRSQLSMKKEATK